jgi:hypothetical protein
MTAIDLTGQRFGMAVPGAKIRILGAHADGRPFRIFSNLVAWGLRGRRSRIRKPRRVRPAGA